MIFWRSISKLVSFTEGGYPAYVYTFGLNQKPVVLLLSLQTEIFGYCKNAKLEARCCFKNARINEQICTVVFRFKENPSFECPEVRSVTAKRRLMVRLVSRTSKARFIHWVNRGFDSGSCSW